MIPHDFPSVTWRQKELLTLLLHFVLVDVRCLCNGQGAEQAAVLSDLFHNLPAGIYGGDFNFAWLRRDLESYQSKYASAFDYLSMLDRALREEDLLPQSANA